MNIQKYAKREIAFRQIETALRLFFTEDDLFSVITLAGSAEEILGQLLAEGGGAGYVGSVLEILRLGNRKQKAKERLVHETDAYVHMDAYQEAMFLLGRAIDDYLSLTGELSAGMTRFNAEVRLKAL